MSKDLNWNVLSEKEEYKSPLFSVYKSKRENSDSTKSGEFITLKTKNWVVAIPWYRREDGVPCFVMEEQFRHGSMFVTREFPAGLIEDGEESLGAAKRELLEETGLEGDFTFLAEVNPNSAFMTNRQTFFLVENLRRSSCQCLDENEEIEVISVPVEEVIKDMGSGIYDNGIMMMALGFFLRLSEKRKELREIKQ